MSAEFGLPGYEDDQLEAMFSLLKSLRVEAGDFTE